VRERKWSLSSIKEAPLEELLTDLELERPTPRGVWAKWLAEENIHPGLGRVRALDLYSDYLTWCFIKGRENTGEPLTVTAFGTLMSARFKKNMGRMGTYYLISRSPNPSIPEYVMEQIAPKPPR
jgi:hypothetical protein